jgi:hypothetical protein
MAKLRFVDIQSRDRASKGDESAGFYPPAAGASIASAGPFPAVSVSIREQFREIHPRGSHLIYILPKGRCLPSPKDGCGNWRIRQIQAARSSPKGTSPRSVPCVRCDWPGAYVPAETHSDPDVAPENWTAWNVSSPNPGEEYCNEGHAAQRRTDHRDLEARGGRANDGGFVPSAGDHRADLLPLEGEVRRDGKRRGQTAETTGRGEPEAAHDCPKSRRHYQFFESTSFNARLSSVSSATTCSLQACRSLIWYSTST